MSRRPPPITAELVLRAYRAGLFPMADRRDSDSLYWLDPEQRGIIPLDRFHLSRRLFRTLRAEPYEVSADRDFAATIASCAHPMPGRAETWINPRIEELYGTLHRMGHAHSIECRRDGILVGGLYGVALGGAFFGESMFSLATDASKIALVHLIARLRLGGFRLLDTQFVTDHLGQFGAEEIPRADYRILLATAVETDAHWLSNPPRDALAHEFRLLAGKEP